MNEWNPTECTLSRLVLRDCEHALSRLRDEPIGTDWRILWVGIMTLLRTVGYVLPSKNSKYPNYLINGVESVCRERGNENNYPDEHKIFWKFICDERNSIVHEYRFSAGQGIRVFVGSNKESEPDYIMHSGKYKGHDQRVLVDEAIKWWEHQIEEMEMRAAAKRIEDLK